MKEAPKNTPASVRGRLSNLSKESGEEFGRLLSRFAIERLLYRLSLSPHRDAFLLKGAALFALWPHVPRRSTRDVDLLGVDESSPARLEEVFRFLCGIAAPEDGLAFEKESVRVTSIRREQRYGGQRVQLEARLDGARIPIQVDVGFGDAVTPAPVEDSYPTLLALPAPRLKVYPIETVVAEKWQAMVELGEANTRMKDFYDVWALSGHHSFDGQILREALQATFARRQTPFPVGVPVALRDEFSRLPAKEGQWRAFTRKSGLRQVPPLWEVTRALHTFLWPLTQALEQSQEWAYEWKPGQGWQDTTRIRTSLPDHQ